MFDRIFNKVQDAENQNQKEKYEVRGACGNKLLECWGVRLSFQPPLHLEDNEIVMGRERSSWDSYYTPSLCSIPRERAHVESRSAHARSWAPSKINPSFSNHSFDKEVIKPLSSLGSRCFFFLGRPRARLLPPAHSSSFVFLPAISTTHRVSPPSSPSLILSPPLTSTRVTNNRRTSRRRSRSCSDTATKSRRGLGLMTSRTKVHCSRLVKPSNARWNGSRFARRRRKPRRSPRRV